MTFQGRAVEGELKTTMSTWCPGLPASVEPTMSTRRPEQGPRRADLAPLANACRQNLRALMTGATPAFYVPDAFDGSVQGLVLSLQLPGRPDRIDCSQVNVMGHLPLQSTLFELTKAAAGALQRQGVLPAAIPGAVLDISVLSDAAMHGSLDAPQLEGLEPRRRALFAAQQNRWAVAWNPGAARGAVA